MCKYMEEIKFLNRELPIFARYELRKHIANCKNESADCNREIAKILDDVKNNHLRRSIIARWD